MKVIIFSIFCLSSTCWAGQKFTDTSFQSAFDIGIIHKMEHQISKFYTVGNDPVQFNCQQVNSNLNVKADTFRFPVTTHGNTRSQRQSVQLFLDDVYRLYGQGTGSRSDAIRIIRSNVEALINNPDDQAELARTLSQLPGQGGALVRCLVLENLVRTRGRSYSSPIWVSLTPGTPGRVEAVLGSQNTSSARGAGQN